MRCLLGNPKKPFPQFQDNIIEALREAGFDVDLQENLRDFLLQVQSNAEAYDLFALDLSFINDLEEELLTAFQRVKARLNKPLLGIAAIPQEVEALVKRLDIKKIVYKYYDPTQIWYVINSITAAKLISNRRWPRYLLDLPVDLAEGKGFHREDSFDLSAGGVFIKTYQPEEPETELKITFKIPDFKELVDCQGKVIFRRAFNPLVGFRRPPGMGIEFVAIDKELRQQIFDFLNKYCASGTIITEETNSQTG